MTFQEIILKDIDDILRSKNEIIDTYSQIDVLKSKIASRGLMGFDLADIQEKYMTLLDNFKTINNKLESDIEKVFRFVHDT